MWFPALEGEALNGTAPMSIKMDGEDFYEDLETSDSKYRILMSEKLKRHGELTATGLSRTEAWDVCSNEESLATGSFEQRKRVFDILEQKS